MASLPAAYSPCYNRLVQAGSKPATHDLLAVSTDAGTRLDRFVAAHCPELSRSRVQELIDGGLVLVNGKPAKSSLKVRGGELVTVRARPRSAPRAEAETITLDVLYEDNALLGRGQSLSQTGDPLRPGIVHRLDKETSGVILVAKNDAAHAKLGEAFRQRAGAALRFPIPGKLAPIGAFSRLSATRRCWKSSSTPGARTRFACTSPRSSIRSSAIRFTVRRDRCASEKS